MLSTISFSPSSRVWIYQNTFPIEESRIYGMQERIREFAAEWVSHSKDLVAFGSLFHYQFVVLMVDETNAGASGCSIDSSVRFLKAFAAEEGLELFDRMKFCWMDDNEEIHTATKEEFEQLYANGTINDDTLVFNNLVKTRAEFEKSWITPLGECWMKRMV